MIDFTTIRQILTSYPDLFEVRSVSKDNIAELKQEYSSVPEDYVEFMTEFGGVVFGKQVYHLYSNFLSPDEIFDISENEYAGILLIGDDLAGVSLGFNTKENWALIEIDSATYEVDPAFVYEDGNDVPAKCFQHWVVSKFKEVIENYS